MHFSMATGFWIAWGALGVVWLAGTRHNKPEARATSGAVRGAQSTLITIGYVLVSGWADWGVLRLRLWPQHLLIAEAGLVLTWIAIAFAIWARWTLGSNWSARPMVKQQHELICRGPYALARHPIYTGMLLGAIGTSAAVDRWGSLIGVVLVAAAFAIKIRQEERLMMQTFPDAYPDYQKRVKAILPGIL